MMSEKPCQKVVFVPCGNGGELILVWQLLGDVMSDDPIKSALERIDHHDAQAALHTAESVRWRTVVNALDELAQRAPRFSDVTAPMTVTVTPAAAPSRLQAWAAGEFLGMPFATAAKAVLQARFDA